MELNDIDFSWTEFDSKIFIPILVGYISFIIFWFPWKSEKLKQSYMDKYGEKGSEKFVMFSKYLGGLSMLILPLVACFIAFPERDLVDYGFGMESDKILPTLLFTVGIVALMAPMAVVSARKEKNWVNYPQIRTKVWDRKLMRKNAWGWAVYLFGYEVLFRGVLFFPLYEEIGLWPTMAINIGLYSATHIPKGLDETIGAIPLAVVLCIITALTGNFWCAYLAHVAMAWTNSFTALKHNPQMTIKK